MIPEVGTSILIQSYKHDGSLHRSWTKAFVVESDEEKCVAITDKSMVIEADGRRWMTREPAVYFLYYKKWFNIIAMMRNNGMYYYCNIATPCVFDEEGLKNIDYDLDLKVYPDGNYQILDEEEYRYHKAKMNYSEDIDTILHYQLDKLINMAVNMEFPFGEEVANRYYQKYIELKSK